MAKKKSKTKLIVIPLVVIVVLALVLGIWYKTTQTGLPECTGGQVLSIDDVSVTQASDLTTDKVIRVTFSTIPTAECLSIQLSQEKIESELKKDGINFDATKSIIGDIKLTKEDKIFNIVEDQNKKFFRIGIKDLGKQRFCTDNDCKNAGISTPIASILEGATFDIFLSSPCRCIYDDQVGVGGRFTSTSGINWETEISISGVGSTILSNSKLSDEIGSIAKIKWAGNLASNVDLSPPLNFEAYKPFSDNKFRMVEQVYQDLKNKYESNTLALKNCDTSGLTTCVKSEMENARGYNSFFDTQTSDKLQSWVGDESIVSSASINERNQIVANLDTPVKYPTFTLDIVASSVGIFVQDLGEPKVTCPSDFKMQSGESKKANLIIQNVGKGTGSFEWSVSCTKGSSFLSPQPPKSITKGSSLTIVGTFGLTTEESTDNAECTFTAKELNSLKTDSCSFSYESEKQIECIDGSKSCMGGNTELWTCKSDGSYQKDKCEFGCEAFEDTFRCKLQKDDGGNGKVVEGVCEPVLKLGSFTIIPSFAEKTLATLDPRRLLGQTTTSCLGIIGGISFATAILVFIIGWFILGLLIKDLLIRTKTLTKKKQLTGGGIALALLLPLVISFILYVLVIKLLIWGIVIGVVYLIIIGVIKAYMKKVGL